MLYNLNFLLLYSYMLDLSKWHQIQSIGLFLVFHSRERRLTFCAMICPESYMYLGGVPYIHTPLPFDGFRSCYQDTYDCCTCGMSATDALISNILSRPSEVGSPTNHPGSGQRQDTGPGILWSVHRWKANLVILPKKFLKKNGPYTRPVLLRQAEPGTSQYACLIP